MRVMVPPTSVQAPGGLYATVHQHRLVCGKSNLDSQKFNAMTENQHLIDDLSRQIRFSYRRLGTVDAIRSIVHGLRRCIDIFYPHESAAQRIGHEFAKDCLSIIGAISRLEDDASDQLATNNDLLADWNECFPPGTELDLTPFQVEELIATRRRQNRELDDQISLLSRQLNRLRSMDVKLRGAPNAEH